MINDLSESDTEVLIKLVNNEMDGICGDLGFLELSQIKAKLEKHLKEKKESK